MKGEEARNSEEKEKNRQEWMAKIKKKECHEVRHEERTNDDEGITLL